MVVLDGEDMYSHACSWDVPSNYPVFIYSQRDNAILWQDDSGGINSESLFKALIVNACQIYALTLALTYT